MQRVPKPGNAAAKKAQTQPDNKKRAFPGRNKRKKTRVSIAVCE
ncbi:hypothetical protein HMPREF3293_02971 [Christensenella minuta]|uniref:Uncharacterized protein n=1 Tax=Christensenella minuta TaxID=626937 RepID=A0A136Q1E8_9FIRM|nr:hypothetical protein HMPREF3293_02971 [Christensenella minuta]